MLSTFEITAVQIFIICAIFNGLIFSMLLLTKTENKLANRFLSLLIFSLSLTFTPYAFDLKPLGRVLWVTWLPFSLTYWIGPSFYFYVKTLTQPDYQPKRIILWHFSAIILNYIHSIYHLFAGGSKVFPWFHHFAELLESFAIISIIIYFILALSEVKRYQRSIFDQLSSIEGLQLRWIKSIILVLLTTFTLIIIYLAVNDQIIKKYLVVPANLYHHLLLSIYAGVIYWLAIKGFVQSQTVALTNVPHYTLNQAEVDGATVKVLIDSMQQDKLYLDPLLSLKSLSKHTQIPEKEISAALNQRLGKNFYTFINEYRTIEVKNRLLDPNYDQHTLLSIALDAGFNSKATFNRIFKAATGQSPKDFRASR
ncbi:MAG: helix-turn-helix domain-containing protein [Saprospiraceae bacterium]|nr:helix-turn-helix domain-containing protein [Saprospiraceae bacterium]